MQQKYLQVVSEEELKVWEEGEVQQRKVRPGPCSPRTQDYLQILEGL